MKGEGLRKTAIDATAIKNSSKSMFGLSSASSSISSYDCETANSNFACADSYQQLQMRFAAIDREHSREVSVRIIALTSSTDMDVLRVSMSSKKNRNSTRLMSTLENLGGAIACGWRQHFIQHQKT
jgi:phage terminase large subunit-like protein